MRDEYRYKPYSLLSPAEFDAVRTHLYYQQAERGEVLLVQEITTVSVFWIIVSGAARFYYEFNFEETLKRDMGPGDSFGGISILLNEGIATKTLRITEDSELLSLDAHYFLKLCEKNDAFTEFFTNAFGRSMINRTYAGIISRQVKDKELNLPFFNQPISAMHRPVKASCPPDTSVARAAAMMAEANSSALLVKSEEGSAGIVTDADLRQQVIARQLSPSSSVQQIMSRPVITISDEAQVYEAFLTMLEKDVRHLVLTNRAGEITGVINEKDLITAQANSTYLLIKSVRAARSTGQLENIHSRLIRMLINPIQTGASTEHITKLITAFSDAIIDKIVTLCLEDLGPPPSTFVFMTMGSEGREEQTFISDQDNALVYRDPRNDDERQKAEEYFALLAERVCNQLHRAGYKLCTGNNMAKNPKWCQPLSVWKEYFHDWIHAAKPEDLLHSSIFFDFRGVWGDAALADELKEYLLTAIGKWPGFLRHLTENTLHFKPPISLLRRFLTERKGPHRGAFDIKVALLPIIDFVRLYALSNHIPETNTLRRLFLLHKKQVLSDREYRDLVQTYNYLMRLRFLRQMTVIVEETREPDNYIYPKTLSYLDQAMLKTAFVRIKKFQQKLSFDFTGTA